MGRDFQVERVLSLPDLSDANINNLVVSVPEFVPVLWAESLFEIFFSTQFLKLFS